MKKNRGFGSKKTKPIYSYCVLRDAYCEKEFAKQSQFTRIACCVMRIAKTNLKKQSQFAPAQMGAKSFLGECYENKPHPGLAGN